MHAARVNQESPCHKTQEKSKDATIKGAIHSYWVKEYKSSQVKSALLSILPHVQYIHTEN